MFDLDASISLLGYRSGMSYARLEAHHRRIAHLYHVSSILQWDEAVIMPPAAGDQRIEAMATLGVVIHEHLTAPQVPEWLDAADSEQQRGVLDATQAANLRELARVFRRARALPAELVEACARAQMRCEQAWRSQRAQNDWKGFAPLLGEVVARKRDAAAALGDALGLSPYDALLDEYEPFGRSKDIDRYFAELERFLPSLIDAVIERQRGETCVQPRGPFPVEAQAALNRALMLAIGFDAQHGRLDVSHHPFCGGVPTDVRMTTRYDAADFTSSLLGVLHETGHAKYEQNLPRALSGQPIGLARGMSIHEGQSLLSEMQVSRSREFLRFAAPKIADAFRDAALAQPGAFEVDNLARLFTRVQRSKIRVEADEVTYPCHILLRYELERALIDGRMRVADIPEAWDSRMHSLLGLRTEGDYRDGCMQDVHWPGGAFGYFPTYTLGAMTAAQLYGAAVAHARNIPEDIARGDFGALDAFLRERVWSQGSVLTTDELLRRATGESLNPARFEAHLRRRYLEGES